MPDEGTEYLEKTVNLSKIKMSIFLKATVLTIIIMFITTQFNYPDSDVARVVYFFTIASTVFMWFVVWIGLPPFKYGYFPKFPDCYNFEIKSLYRAYIRKYSMKRKKLVYHICDIPGIGECVVDKNFVIYSNTYAPDEISSFIAKINEMCRARDSELHEKI